MSRWFRHYAGMMRDDKLVRVAIKSRQPIERVLWVWGAILESAAELDDGGRYDVDAAEVAYFLRTDEADILAIQAALADAGRVAEGFVVKWGNRQFQSDKSAARVAAYRERQRTGGRDGNSEKETRNADVTLHGRYGNAPETETETEADKETTSVVSSTQVRKRGCRLPVDWTPPALPDDVADNAWPGFQEAEGCKFRDYWAAQPGQKGVKTDWDATWRNWVRRAMERQGNGLAQRSNGTQFGSRRNPALDMLRDAISDDGGFAAPPEGDTGASPSYRRTWPALPAG